MYIYLILISLVLTIYGVENQNYFHIGLLLQRTMTFSINYKQIKMEKPWLVFFLWSMKKIRKNLFQSLTNQQRNSKQQICTFQLLICIQFIYVRYENEDVRDRIVISKFPQLIYFDMNSLMYRYNGELTFESVSNFVRNEEWNQLQGKKVPKEINYWKRTLRKLTGFVAILIYSIIFTIIAVIWYFQNRSHSILLKKIRRIDIAQSNILEKKKKYMKIE